MFQLKRTTKNIDIYASGRQVSNGWVSITIDKSGIIVYISKDKTRAYWIGRTEGQSAKLAIKFDDNQHKITINKYLIKTIFIMKFITLKVKIVETQTHFFR